MLQQRQKDRFKRLTKADRFTCYKCCNSGAGRQRCQECKGCGELTIEHGLVRMIEDIIERKEDLAIEAEDEQFGDAILPVKEQLIKLQPPLAVHCNYFCDNCKAGPIKGTRYTCTTCQDFDLCSKCHEKNTHGHKFKAFQKEINHDQQLKEKLKERMTKSSINYGSMSNSFLFRSRNL